MNAIDAQDAGQRISAEVLSKVMEIRAEHPGLSIEECFDLAEQEHWSIFQGATWFARRVSPAGYSYADTGVLATAGEWIDFLLVIDPVHITWNIGVNDAAPTQVYQIAIAGNYTVGTALGAQIYQY